MLNFKKCIKEEIEKIGIKLDNVAVEKCSKMESRDFAIPCFTINLNDLYGKNKTTLEKVNYCEYDENIYKIKEEIKWLYNIWCG